MSRLRGTLAQTTLVCSSRVLVAVLALPLSSSCAERPRDRAATANSQRRASSQPATAQHEPVAAASAVDQLSASADSPRPSDGTPAKLRHAQKAGGWYPDDRAWAIAEMQRLFRAARAAPAIPQRPLALIVPHAGWRYSGVAAAAAFRNLHRGDFERVILLGPSHGHAFAGFSLPNYAAYETPLGQIPVCPEAAALRDGELVRDLPEADYGEHSQELELPWLQESLGSFCLIPILVGSTNADTERALADRLRKVANDRTLFVVSSDFVHYGPRFDYLPFGASVVKAHDKIFELEQQAVGFLERSDPRGFRELIQKTDATICGYRGQLVLLELLSARSPKAEAVPFSHYSSADLPAGSDTNAADASGSVGYVSLGYYADKTNNQTKPLAAPPATPVCAADAIVSDDLGQRLLQLAQATLATKLGSTDDLSQILSNLPPTTRLDCRQAVFVTLKSKGELRGCVGQVEPEYPLAEAVVRSAIDSAVNDRRFSPVESAELGDITLELTVLGVPQPVNGYRDIELGKHGIILSVGGRRALFLPQVPGEQGWGLEDTLRALSQKAGLDSSAWQGQDAKFSVFTGKVFEPRLRHDNPSRPTKPGARGSLLR